MALPVFRIADWHGPLRVNPNRSPGRFHRAGQIAQYCSFHPLGPWAEFLRAEQPPPPLRAGFRHRVWVLQVADADVPSIDFENAETWGISPDQLVSDDHAACRELGDRLRQGGYEAVIVPSAALPGTANFVMFGPRVASPWDAEPIDSVDVPAALVAEDATIPDQLVPLVRFRGEPHAGLEAWRTGEDDSFDDPVWHDWHLPGG